MTDEITISKREYEELQAAALFQDMALDFLHGMPTDLLSLFEGDDRLDEWLKVYDPEWYAELQEERQERENE